MAFCPVFGLVIWTRAVASKMLRIGALEETTVRQFRLELLICGICAALNARSMPEVFVTGGD